MVPIAEKERVKALIRDTLTLLCRNGLPFSDKFTIEALIGITIDEGDVVLMSMNEMVKSDAQKQNLPSEECAVQDSASHRNSGSRRESGHRRRLKKSKFTSVNRHKRPHADESRDSADDDAGEEPLSPLREDTNSDQQQEPDPKRVKSEQSESADNTKRELGDVNEQASDKIQEKCDDDLQQDVNETDNQNDIIIKQEVDDDIEWISSSFQSEASVPPEMMSETSRSSYQNQMFPSGMPFQRTATVTSADSGPGPSEQEQETLDQRSLAKQDDFTVIADISIVHLVDKETDLPTPSYDELTGMAGPDDSVGTSLSVGAAPRSIDVLRSVKSTSESSKLSCHVCHKIFSLKHNLLRHEKIHTKSISCTMCKGIFPTEYLLKEHTNNVHSGTKHQCDECGNIFKYKSSLFSHQRTHKGQFRYLCPHCGRGNNHKSNHEAHVNSHTGTKTNICAKCGTNFRSVSSLTYHVAGCGLKERPHHCSVCQKSFKREKYLKEHTSIHTNPDIYQCSRCGNRFNHRGALKRHRDRKHADDM